MILKQRSLGWPFPQDYKEFVLENGAIEINGIKIIDIEKVSGRGEYAHDKKGEPVFSDTRCFVIFGESLKEENKEIYAFAFNCDLMATLKDVRAVAAGEERDVFLGFPFEVVLCQGVGALREIERPFAKTFTDFLKKISF